MANAVTMNEAAETLVEKSAASCGSIGSTQRSDTPETKAPMARRRMASPVPDPLGRKPFDLPVVARPDIEQAVVQPIGAALPELDLARQHAVAAPVRRPRRRVAVERLCLRHRLLEHRARRHGFALLGGPGGVACAKGPRD